MRILAVDYGEVRTGLAVCDRTEFLASPVGVIEERKFEELLMKVMFIAKDHGVGEIIVGHPKNMDGSEGEKANKCRKFAEDLEAGCAGQAVQSVILHPEGTEWSVPSVS